ncbi:MAG: ABC transporter ATP-binding protein [Candidatus Coproplasma sp.]
MMEALTVKNLTKQYPRFKLDGVSFSVGEGRVAGLIGRNGAGKSTTIKGILRFISAEGSVEIFGKSAFLDEEGVKQIIGYVGGGFRYYPLKTLLSVRKAFSAFYPEWNEEKYQRYLTEFALDESKKVKELSEGMKVKFSLALALSHGAKLLIMDEPTSGLDPLSREEFCDIILSLVREEGVSVLFSTHITSDLERIADDIIYISDGKVLADGELNELKNKYLSARFSSKEEAQRFNAIGVKCVKGGYEGLILNDGSAPTEIDTQPATLDEIMIHIEQAKKGGKQL